SRFSGFITLALMALVLTGCGYNKRPISYSEYEDMFPQEEMGQLWAVPAYVDDIEEECFLKNEICLLIKKAIRQAGSMDSPRININPYELEFYRLEEFRYGDYDKIIEAINEVPLSED